MYGFLTPIQNIVSVGSTNIYEISGQYENCYGSGYSLAVWPYSWNVAIPSVASVWTENWGIGRVSGESEGTTNLAALWGVESWEPFGEECRVTEWTHEEPGSAQVPTPTSLQTVSDQYIVQQFNNYNRERHYQVLDQNSNPINQSGLAVTETYSSWSPNGCNLTQINTGQAVTNNQGRFKDNYSLKDVPTCNTNPQCTSSVTQTIKVSGKIVGTFNLTYGCSAVTITP